jgi:ribosomal protein S6--L-glutamate ligase
MQIAVLSFAEILSENLESLRNAASIKGVELVEIEPTQLSLVIGPTKNSVHYQGKPFTPQVLIHRTVAKFSHLIRPIIRSLEASGTNVLNDIESAMASRSKLDSALIFKEHHLPFLESQFLVRGEQMNIEIETPLISKPVLGSQGKGINFHPDSKSAEQYFAEMDRDISERFVEPYLVQQDLGGEVIDLRAHVVGGRCIGLMKREPTDKSRVANIAQGGTGVPIPLTHPAAELAVKTVRAFGLEYAGVDLLMLDNKLYVSEIDAWAGFVGIERVCEVSVSEAILDLAIERVKKK